MLHTAAARLRRPTFPECLHEEVAAGPHEEPRPPSPPRRLFRQAFRGNPTRKLCCTSRSKLRTNAEAAGATAGHEGGVVAPTCTRRSVEALLSQPYFVRLHNSVRACGDRKRIMRSTTHTSMAICILIQFLCIAVPLHEIRSGGVRKNRYANNVWLFCLARPCRGHAHPTSGGQDPLETGRRGRPPPPAPAAIRRPRQPAPAPSAAPGRRGSPWGGGRPSSPTTWRSPRGAPRALPPPTTAPRRRLRPRPPHASRRRGRSPSSPRALHVRHLPVLRGGQLWPFCSLTPRAQCRPHC